MAANTHRVGQTSVYVPELALGTGSFGATPSEVNEAEALEMVHYALDHGLNLIDTAPWYGDKVSERFVGLALAGRSGYRLATKVCLEFRGRDAYRMYRVDDVLRGLDGSFERLQRDTVDILHIHDPIYEAYDQIVSETFPALAELKADGVTQAISVGTGDYKIARDLARDLPLDAVMLAGRYTLLEQPALDTINELRERGISVFSAGVYNSGILATGTTSPDPKYNYQSAPPEIIARVQKLEALCGRHNVPLKAAAAQFVRAHPAISCIVMGADSVAQIEENIRVFSEPIPAAFWQELRESGLVDERSPLPA